MRFSIGRVMVLVAVCAIALVALIRPSPLWAGVLYILTLGLLGTATALTIVAVGPRRCFWTGFAVFGWIYFVAAFFLAYNDDSPYLPDHVLHMDWHSPLFPEAPDAKSLLTIQEVSSEPIGKLLATLLFAFIGSILVHWIASREESAGPGITDARAARPIEAQDREARRAEPAPTEAEPGTETRPESHLG